MPPKDTRATDLPWAIVLQENPHASWRPTWMIVNARTVLACPSSAGGQTDHLWQRDTAMITTSVFLGVRPLAQLQ